MPAPTDIVKVQCPLCIGSGQVPAIVGKVPLSPAGFRGWFLRNMQKLGPTAQKMGIAPIRFQTRPAPQSQPGPFGGTDAMGVATSDSTKNLAELKERRRDAARFGPDAIPEAKDEDHRILEG